MKTFTILLMLVLVSGQLEAVTCWPEEVYGGYSAIGCPNMVRTENYRIVFPDNFSRSFAVSGTGECEQASDCDPYKNAQLQLAGMTRCGPLFYTPSISNGFWTRKVQSRQADLQLKYCSNQKTLAGPVVCSNYGVIRVWSITHTCPGCHLPMP